MKRAIVLVVVSILVLPALAIVDPGARHPAWRDGVRLEAAIEAMPAGTRGLAGEDIPFMARIVAVADTYDAMTSNRPYRGALTHQRTMDEVVFHSGTQFDPDVVDAFVAAMTARTWSASRQRIMSARASG